MLSWFMSSLECCMLACSCMPGEEDEDEDCVEEEEDEGRPGGGEEAVLLPGPPPAAVAEGAKGGRPADPALSASEECEAEGVMSGL